MPRPGKKQINVYVSIESHQALHAFAAKNGMDVTALIDALGAGIAEHDRLPSQQYVVREARRIAAERRRRDPQ